MSATARLDAALVEVIRRSRLPEVHRRVGALAGVRLDRGGYVVASTLARLGRPVRLTALAAELGLDVSTASRHVCGLERARLVEREPDPSDGRAQLIRMSAEGLRTVGRLRDGRRAVIDEATAAWPDGDREHLAVLLERLAGALGDVTADGDSGLEPVPA